MKPTTTGVHGKILQPGQSPDDGKDSDEQEPEDKAVNESLRGNAPRSTNDIIRADMKD